ncbi:MAG TPA: primosomal protein N', partial [Campylobacteraceae bacterium]|nr:primosomal protein N' [Campylobacteraceae bacterium]
MQRFRIDCDIALSAKQQQAYDFVRSHETALLFGDTGSGKTEIYMKLLEDVINEGKSAIFLMPEISLTPQMQKRLKKKFGDMVAIWHSKITKKSKEKIIAGIERGEVRILAGARSTLFVPLPDLGAIIVDEEHDDSYKASNRPRYHARDVAIYMGRVLGAKVVLGSATPSLTSYHKFPFFRLRETFFDTQKSIIFTHEEEGISERIMHELSQTLAQNHQAIIFLPTRANYKYLTCIDCGKFVECPFCSVGMSIHRERNALRCHYCNYMQRIPSECPACGGRHLKTNRMGTAQVVMELSEKFPEKRFVKFDRDEVTTQTKLKKILKAFNDHEIDVLVGTQMLSKGHDYHDVRLAVVFGIDTILAQADFRARERAMSLLLQVAGRSGRKGEGKVIVQTANAEFFAHYIDDYEKFLKEELASREGLYPPFRKLMKFMIAHKSKAKALEILERLQVCLSDA